MRHQKREDEARRGRGADTGASQGEDVEGGETRGAGSRQDTMGIWSCVLAGSAIVAELAAYLVAVGYGIAATLLCAPLFVVAIVLSVRTRRADSPGRLWRAGMGLSVGGLVGSLLLFYFVASASFLMALDPSLVDTMGPLALLNWG